MSKEYLDCPFCGGEGKLEEEFENGGLIVACFDCDATTDADWNIRADTVTDKEVAKAYAWIKDKSIFSKDELSTAGHYLETLRKALSRPQVDIDSLRKDEEVGSDKYLWRADIYNSALDVAKKLMEASRCVAGCKNYTGGEKYHHKDCQYYPESMSKLYDECKTLSRPKHTPIQAKMLRHALMSAKCSFNTDEEREAINQLLKECK